MGLELELKTKDLLRRFRSILPRSSILTIYKTFIRSQLDHANVIYNMVMSSCRSHRIITPVLMKNSNLSNTRLVWQ